MLYLFAHAFFKALLFLSAGSVIHATEEQEVDKLGGLWGKLPITAPVFAVGALAMAGLIPFSGYWAKDEILTGIHNGDMSVWVLVITILTLPITALYMTRVVMLTFFGAPKDEHVHEHAHESLAHEHPHRHDEHHRHAHPDGWDGREPHVHPHRHEPLRHSHPHFPDAHHRHSH